MADRADNRDELIDKLDHLISRSRVPARTQGAEVPVLTEALPEVPGDAVPTLTEAVAGPGQSQARQLGRNELERVIAMRLAESIERAASKLGGEFPAQREALDSLRSALVKSLPELVRKTLSEPKASADAPRAWPPAGTGKND